MSEHRTTGERARWPDPRAPFERTCRGCGCTDGHACPGGCSWVLLDVQSPSGICSECAEEVEWDPRVLTSWNMPGPDEGGHHGVLLP